MVRAPAASRSETVRLGPFDLVLSISQLIDINQNAYMNAEVVIIRPSHQDLSAISVSKTLIKDISGFTLSPPMCVCVCVCVCVCACVCVCVCVCTY